MSKESNGTIELSTKDALEYIRDYFGVETNYKMAKMLGIQPIQIQHFENGKLMSNKTADKFLQTFGIVITDAFTKRKKDETL